MVSLAMDVCFLFTNMSLKCEVIVWLKLDYHIYECHPVICNVL